MTDAELAALHRAAMTLPRPWTAAEISSLRLMPGAIECLHPEGFALGRLVLDEVELLTIAVHPRARRRGIARTLLAAYHAQATRKGAVTSHLEVAETNTAARALYQSDGYAVAGRRRGYYTEATPAVDAITMTRQL